MWLFVSAHVTKALKSPYHIHIYYLYINDLSFIIYHIEKHISGVFKLFKQPKMALELLLNEAGNKIRQSAHKLTNWLRYY